jgi:hypothetical protein
MVNSKKVLIGIVEEENGYKFKDIIYPHEQFVCTIENAMDRFSMLIIDEYEKQLKREIDNKSAIYADSDKFKQMQIKVKNKIYKKLGLTN